MKKKKALVFKQWNNWINQIQCKHFSYLFLVLFFLSLIPIFIIAFYNHPAADDYASSLVVHQAWRNSGSIITTFGVAFSKVLDIYQTWSGLFASMLWTVLQPGLFAEKYYGISAIVVTIIFVTGMYYFGRVCLQNYCKVSAELSNCIIVPCIFSAYHCMPNPNEGIFWHAGAVNYTLAFGFMMMLLGLVLSIMQEQNKKYIIWKSVWASILSICVGGGNLISALISTILLIFAAWIWLICQKENSSISHKKMKIYAIFVPLIFQLISFGISLIAPGNQIRMGSVQGFSAPKAILVSFYYALNDPLEKWLTWPVVVLLCIAIPFMWSAVGDCEYSFKHPILVSLLIYSVFSATFTPSLYAQGTLDAGRLLDICFYFWILAVYCCVFYILGWWRKQGSYSRKESSCLSLEQKNYLIVILLFWMIGSAFTIKIEDHVYVGSTAVISLLNGQAKEYLNTHKERLHMLQNEENQRCLLPSFENPPYLLDFQDITNNPDDWLNQVVAQYYEKEQVWHD